MHKSFVKLNAVNARKKVIVFPFAGGSPNAFRAWGEPLAPECELWSLQLPGRANRFTEPCLEDMTAVVASIAVELPRLIHGAEFVFFGHSNGALIAHALAHYIERMGLPQPKHVILSGKRPPLGPERRDSDLPDKELVAMLTELGGMPADIVNDVELLNLFLPVIRADLKIGERYRPSPNGRIATAVTVLGGEDDRHSVEELEGWNSFCRAIHRIELLAGDHFFINRHVDHIAGMLKNLVHAPA